MASALETFCANRNATHAQMITTIAQAVSQASPGLTADIKWGKLTFAREGDYHHWLCQIAETKKAIVLYFHFGALLDDPSGILQAGKSNYLRKIEFAHPGDINADLIGAYTAQAVARLDAFKNQLAQGK